MQWERSMMSIIFKEEDDSEVIDITYDALNEFRRVALTIIEGRTESEWTEKLLLIASTSHGKMNASSSPQELNTLRKVYTDASILLGLTQSLMFCSLEAISTLDKAIIIAGPFGSGRLDFILDAICRIQFPLSCNWPAKTSNSSKFCSSAIKMDCLKCTIPCLSAPPSFIAFQSAYFRQPFLLRNYAANWPALCSHPWRQHAYLLSVAGPGRVVPVEIGTDYRLNDWQQKIMLWEEFLSLLDFEDHPSSMTDNSICYMAQHDLTKQFPRLLEDIEIPDYLFADVELPHYHPPRNDSKTLLNVWLGPKGTLSPAHFDPYFNFYVQVVGYKSVWLAPPSVSDYMYTSSTTPNSDAISPCSTLSNTSRADVFSQELQEFPDFIDKVVPQSATATLGPGDALFFPPGWWHSMRSESTSLSLSMWF